MNQTGSRIGIKNTQKPSSNDVYWRWLLHSGDQRKCMKKLWSLFETNWKKMSNRVLKQMYKTVFSTLSSQEFFSLCFLLVEIYVAGPGAIFKGRNYGNKIFVSIFFHVLPTGSHLSSIHNYGLWSVIISKESATWQDFNFAHVMEETSVPETVSVCF